MIKSRKLLLLLLAIIVLAASIVFIISRNNKVTKQSTTEITDVSVRMKWFFSGTMSGWFTGKESGFFEDQKINIEINPGGPDNSAVKLVAAGTDMFGVVGADEVLIARDKGIPIVAIGVLFKDSPIGFISKKKNNIDSPAKWYDKTIEVDFGSNAEIQFRALVKKFNVKGIKEVPYAYSLVPFIEDKVDVSVAYLMDQVITLEKRGIELNVLTSKQYGINPYGDVIITTESTLKEKPELVKRFMNAVIKSHSYAVENPDKAVEYLISNATNLKYENEFDIWKATIPFLVPDETMSKICIMEENRWKETLDILTEFNVIEKNKIELSKAFSIIK